MKVQVMTTYSVKQMLYFPLDYLGQLVISLPDEDIKEILSHAIQNLRQK